MSVPSGETLHSFPTAYPDVLARGRQNTLRGTLQYAGAAPTISAATLKLYKPDGTEISGISVALATNVATATVPASSLPDTLPLGEGYRELWTFTIGGIDYQYERTAALARIQLSPALIDSVVLARVPSFARTIGASTSQGFMDQAWEQIIRAILKAGHLSYLIRTPDALRECHLLLTLALGYEAAAAGSDTPQYAAAAARYRDQYKAEWNSISWQLDYDNDGAVDDPQSRQTASGGILHTWGVVGGRRPVGF